MPSVAYHATARARKLAAVVVNAVPHADDASQLLDVEVHELAGPMALVAHDLARAIDRRQPAQAEPPQLPPHRRERDAARSPATAA